MVHLFIRSGLFPDVKTACFQIYDHGRCGQEKVSARFVLAHKKVKFTLNENFPDRT